VAAPRSALGGAAPKRDAAAATPLPPPPPREDRGPRDDRAGYRGDRGPRRDDRGPRRDDRGPRRDDRPQEAGATTSTGGQPRPQGSSGGSRQGGRPPRRDDRGPRRDDRAPSSLSADEAAQVEAARGSVASERADLEAAEASPEALAAGKDILEELMRLLGFDVRIEVETGDTSRLNVVGSDDAHEALGALIGRKGERLSALQHLVNLMLSRRMGEWTRVLVDVEDYRGRRERQLRDIATRAAARVEETGKMLQLEPMPALERRWIHLALRDHPTVATQSIGEEPNRRIVVLPRAG
jgi:spoIIIJ-associated protein